MFVVVTAAAAAIAAVAAVVVVVVDDDADVSHSVYVCCFSCFFYTLLFSVIFLSRLLCFCSAIVDFVHLTVEQDFVALSNAERES